MSARKESQREEEFYNELVDLLKRHIGNGTKMEAMANMLNYSADKIDMLLSQKEADKAAAAHLKATGRLT